MAIIDKPETDQQIESGHDDGEFPRPLSKRDSIASIEMSENTPAPDEVLKAAIARAKNGLFVVTRNQARDTLR